MCAAPKDDMLKISGKAIPCCAPRVQAEAIAASFVRGKRPCTASSTQISSSSSSQRRARPCNRSSTFSSWACGALASRGYFVAGKLTIRWSKRSKQIRRPSIQHRRAAAAFARSVSMVANIRLDQGMAMLFHEPLDISQLGPAEAKVGRERDRLEPILGLEVVARDVDVRWLDSFPAVEVKSIRPNTHHRRHDPIVPFVRHVSNSLPASMAASTDHWRLATDN